MFFQSNSVLEPNSTVEKSVVRGGGGPGPCAAMVVLALRACICPVAPVTH